eukprot:4154294-Pleurochrysis_carterae.AAC.3
MFGAHAILALRCDVVRFWSSSPLFILSGGVGDTESHELEQGAVCLSPCSRNSCATNVCYSAGVLTRV